MGKRFLKLSVCHTVALDLIKKKMNEGVEVTNTTELYFIKKFT